MLFEIYVYLSNLIISSYGSQQVALHLVVRQQEQSIIEKLTWSHTRLEVTLVTELRMVNEKSV